jgi:actin-related protein
MASFRGGAFGALHSSAVVIDSGSGVLKAGLSNASNVDINGSKSDSGRVTPPLPRRGQDEGVAPAGQHGLTPSVYFPSIIGKYKKAHEHTSTGAFDIDGNIFLIGEQAIEHREQLVLQYPMTHGVITDWDDMERLWHFTFKR